MLAQIVFCFRNIMGGQTDDPALRQIYGLAGSEAQRFGLLRPEQVAVITITLFDLPIIERQQGQVDGERLIDPFALPKGGGGEFLGKDRFS